MPINPLYKPQSSESREKLPYMKFLNVGDKVVGTIVEVGDPFHLEKEFRGEKRSVQTQVITLKDAVITLVNTEDDEGEPTVIKHDKMTVWLQKPGMFYAVGDALEKAGLSDLAAGQKFGMKWSGFGVARRVASSRPHKFVVQIAQPE